MISQMVAATSILLVFYLIMLGKWSCVKRPSLYFIGALGLLAVFAGQFFVVGGAMKNPGLRTVANVFNAVGGIVAFIGLVAACSGAKLPGIEKLQQQAGQGPTE